MDTKTASKRLLSLDALRGLDMFFLVGIGGILRALPTLNDTPINNWLANQIRHPEWNGFTVWDIIFPLFIFMVGVSMSFSFSKRLKQEGGKRKLYKHILIRTLTLMFLGLVLWQRPGFVHPHFGYYSVLYRIGFAYFFASIIFLNSSIKTQAYWAFGLTIGYWIILRFTPVPGYGMGNFSQEGNLMTYLGNQIAIHISPNFSNVLSISLLSSVSTALFGGIVGQWLKSDRSGNEKTKWLLLSGIVFIIIGLLIHLDFPINKKIGSTSFVFLTVGISAFLLSVFYWVIDVKGFKKWSYFFVVVGVNSIAIYVANSLLKFSSVANVFVGGFDFGEANVLVLAIAIATIKWLFCYYLYKNKIFFKI